MEREREMRRVECTEPAECFVVVVYTSARGEDFLTVTWGSRDLDGARICAHTYDIYVAVAARVRHLNAVGSAATLTRSARLFFFFFDGRYSKDTSRVE